MKIFVTSDTHNSGFGDKFKIGKFDAIIHCGDITNLGVQNFPIFNALQSYIKLMGTPFYWIPGNHDLGLTQDNFTGHCLLERITMIKDKRVLGLSLSPCYNIPRLADYWDYMTADKKQEENYYKNAPECDILVSHCPPTGCDEMDTCEVSGTPNLGSEELRKYIERVQPELVLCGHIHKSKPYERFIGKTRIINVATVSMEIEI